MSTRKSPKTKPTWWDGLVAAAVIALAVAVAAGFYAPKKAGGPLRAVISAEGKTLEQGTLLELSGTHVYTNRGYTLTVEIADGMVNVTDSDCPNHDCQHTPPISRAGESIVCLPAQIVIHLEGAPADGPDVVVG